MDDQRKRPRRYAAALIYGALAPLVYLFSFGPAWVLVSYDWMPHEIVGAVYFPLFWLSRKSLLFDDFIGWYMKVSIELAELVLPPTIH